MAVALLALPVSGGHAVAAAQTPASSRTGAPAPSRSIPGDHWAYALLDPLRYPGRIVVRSLSGTYQPLTEITRGEFAIATAQLLEHYGLLGDSPGRAVPALPSREKLRVLVREFEPELRAIHVDVSAAKARLDDLLKKSSVVVPSFTDVPEGHWAYPSVEAVRQQGLMVGFPDGRFYGNR